MLTKEQVLEAVKSGKKSDCLDGRDFGRLADFFPESDLAAFGFKVNEGVKWEPREWTHEAIIEGLKGDVAFGFEKALNKRGISASFQNSTVKTWLWVLEDELQDHDDYAQYGLPLLKAVAVKYGFPNEIGDDAGNEANYASDG
jgi:hypothetical protein